MQQAKPAPPDQAAGRRVVHLNDIAHVASTLAVAQTGRGDRTLVVDPSKPGGEWPYPRKALTIPLRAASLAVAIGRVVAFRPDIVHIHYATHGIVGPAMRHPFVIHCHGTDLRSVSVDGPAWRVLRWVARRAGAVLVATPDLLSRGRQLRADTVFLPNPIDLRAFAPGGSPTRDLLLGTRLHPIKGAATAIDAAVELVRRRPSTTVTVVDDGPLAAEAVARLGSAAELVPRVPHHRMPDRLRAHRVTLGQFRLGILSQFELEAMACGVPIVADLHAVSAYDEPPPVPSSGSVTTVAGQLASWLQDEAGMRATGLAMRAWVGRVHAVERVVRRLDEVYERAGGERPG
jgi:glycosyltransferase involved in cell wall biosynthesis